MYESVEFIAHVDRRRIYGILLSNELITTFFFITILEPILIS